MTTSIVHGFVADKFSAVRDAFEANFAEGSDLGASCCATLEVETVSRSLVFRQEIAEPLNSDFHIGMPATADSRVAETIPWPPPQTDVKPVFSEIQELTFRNMPYDVATTIRTRAWRAAEIPAVNGFGNARSVAGSIASSPTEEWPAGSDSCPRPVAAKPWSRRSKGPI